MTEPWNTKVFDRRRGSERFAMGQIRSYCAERGVEMDQPTIEAQAYDFRRLDETDLRILTLWHCAFGRKDPYTSESFQERRDLKDHYLRFLEFHQRQGVPL